MGGGGNAGKIDYPPYIKEIHSQMMVGTDAGVGIIDVPVDLDLYSIVYGLGGATGMMGTSNNPFNAVVSFDPDGDILAALNELTEVEAILDNVNLKDRSVETDITFKDKHKLNLAQGYNRIASTMASVNAVVGTTYPSSLALMEVNYLTDVKDMKLKNDSEMVRSKIAAVGSRVEFLRNKVALKMDQTRQDTLYNVDEKQWELLTVIKAMSSIGSISGVGTVTTGDGQASGFLSVLGGMASGASTGASFGPIGAGVGAGIGALLSIF